MKRSLFITALAGMALASLSIEARAQNPVQLGIAGGASLPTGDLKDIADMGFNGTVTVGMTPALIPLGIRIDGAFNQFAIKDELADGNVRFLSVTGNLVYKIPGAMVSLICHNAIEKAVKELRLTDPASILNKVNELVRQAFSKEEVAIMDGMDISICCLNRSSRQLCWAGANIPLWILRTEGEQAEIIELKPDKQPIGRYVTNKPFTNHTIEVSQNDSIFLFSDGYSDQFGGDKGKKFMSRQLRKLLLDNCGKELSATKKILQSTLELWKGKHEQVDDITILGIRI